MIKPRQLLKRLFSGDKSVVSELPPGRSSHLNMQQTFTSLSKGLDFITPDFAYEFIPVIRKLYLVNSSVSLAATTIMELANPGLKLEFPQNSEEEQIAFRQHIEQVSKVWATGTTGLHGIVNKLILQVYLGGAMSVEWVLSRDLSGVQYIAFIDPETVRVRWNSRAQSYDFYQVPPTLKKIPKNLEDTYKRLNPYTYQYLGLFNDQEVPIGIPPFLSALNDIQTQLQMLKNIGYVSDQLGLMGFLEVLLKKPIQKDGESEEAYKGRLKSLLNTTKGNIQTGLKDGIVAGFKDDHEFNFHSSTKDTSGVADIFDINHRMVSNGLFIPPQFMGLGGGGSETLLSVVFTKMLSQLNNIQTFISDIIGRGVYLELLLANYPIKSVKVSFKPSTVTDDLKLQQSREIKQRVARIAYADGVYNLTQYARDLGLDKPDLPEPRVPIDPNGVMRAQQAKENDQKQDNVGDRGRRDQNKSQPKRRDNDTRKRGN